MSTDMQTATKTKVLWSAELFCLLFACLLSLSAAAQQLSNSRRANQRYQSAMQALQQGRWDQAISYLEQTIQADDNFAEAHQGLGDLYRRNKQYGKAAAHYTKVIQLKPHLTAMTWFGLGESLLLTGAYQEALLALQEYEHRATGTSPQRKISSKYIQDCLFSLDFFRNQEKEKVKQTFPGPPVNLGPGINTQEDEYFPKLTADGRQMIFTRKVNQQESFFEAWRIDPQTGQSPQTERSLQTDWSEARLLEGEINTAHYNEGAHCISLTGNFCISPVATGPAEWGAATFMYRGAAETGGAPPQPGAQHQYQWMGSAACIERGRPQPVLCQQPFGRNGRL